METSSSVPEYQPFPPSLAADLGVALPRGILLPAELCRTFVRHSGVEREVLDRYNEIDGVDANEVMIKSFRLRKILDQAALPPELVEEIGSRLASLSASDFILHPEGENPLDGAIRPRGPDSAADAVRKFYVDHIANGLVRRFEEPDYHALAQAPALVVQQAPAATRSGLALSFEPDSGAQEMIAVYSTWGLAEDISRRSVARDEFLFHKTVLSRGCSRAAYGRIGVKEFQLRYDPVSHRLDHLPLARDLSRAPSLSEAEAVVLARCVDRLERQMGEPVELSWSGSEGSLRLLCLRRPVPPPPASVRFYRQKVEAPELLRGEAVGHSVATGRVRVVTHRSELEGFRPGEVLVAEATEPDWEPYFKRAAALVTARDRRVSHSTILAREIGIPAILGAHGCCSALTTGRQVTVSCCQAPVGRVLEGEVEHAVEEFNLHNMPRLKTALMVNLSMPERALVTAQLPWQGAGLIRSEFMIGGWVKIHPLALLKTNLLPPETQDAVARLTHGFSSPAEYFLTRMSQAVALIAAAFHPRPITLRLSDFKSDEYARLLGGAGFEPKERNSMLGWRGASRYLDPEFRDAFELELAAVRRAREELGFENIKLMVPFCRTPEEGEEVLQVIHDAGLRRGQAGFEVWTMAELPSNVLLAGEFAALFDGMSIGSSDLTGLTLGVDRASERLADYFDELHPALMRAYELVISACQEEGKRVSFCGQAASEDPEFAALLAEMGVDILSLAPDALHATLERLSGTV